MLYRLILSYRGEAYAGWQRQPNAVAVQQVVEEALAKLVGDQVRVVGASRTDSGVHALGQVAHLTLASPWPPSALVHGTNRHLPSDIRVLAAAEAPPGFHARRDAVAKCYRYQLSRAAVVSPLESPFTVAVPADLDRVLLTAGARAVEGRHDFSAFAKSGGAHTQPFRTVFRARFLEEEERLTFLIIGDGFLRGMVRALIGTLLQLATTRLSLADFKGLLDGGSRSDAGPNAQARGLVLQRVYYEEDGPQDWENRDRGSSLPTTRLREL